MQTEYKLLVVEDRPDQLAAVRSLIERSNGLVSAEYATTLEEAIEIADSWNPDAILSDAHFPTRQGGEEEPNGIKMIDHAMDNEIPFTIVTSSYHHDGITEPVNQRSRSSGMELIDVLPDNPVKEKRWHDGLATVVHLVDLVRKGVVTFDIVRNEGDGKHKGMVVDEGGEKYGVKLLLPPWKRHLLDEVKAKLGMKTAP